ncbi:MAG: c-type cytochrome [Anaerolineae bacterium]
MRTISTLLAGLRKPLAICLLALAVATLAVQAAAAQGPTPPAVPPPTSRPSAVRGKDLFTQNCQPCHGALGRGDGETMRAQGAQAANFADPAFKQGMSPADAYAVISEGRIGKLMPPWKNRLTPEQMWDAAFYAWWLGAGPRSVARGKAVWEANCASCHGANGAGVAAADLSKANQTISQSGDDLAAQSSKVPEHASVWAKLSADDKVAALDYTRSLGFDTPPLPTLNGAIQGSLRQGTPGATLDVSKAVSVTLLSLVGQSPEAEIPGKLAADGSFKFDNLIADADHGYGVAVNYGGVNYYSPLVRLDSNNLSQTTTLNVYDTTTTDPGMQLSRAHILVDFVDSNTLRIGELYQLDNTGNRTFVAPPNGATMVLPLPPGAKNFQFQNEDLDAAAQVSGATVRVDTPWSPGPHQVVLSYDLPYDGSYDLSRSFPYPVGEINVLVADKGIQLTPTGMQAKPSTSTPQGESFQTYQAQNLAVGQSIGLSLSGAPQNVPAPSAASSAAPSAASGAASNAAPPAAGSAARPAASTVPLAPTYQSSLVWIGILLAALALVAVLLWPRLRTPFARRQQVGLTATQEELLDQIAALDDAYAAGQVSEVDYTVQRADAKARLVAVMRMLKAQE